MTERALARPKPNLYNNIVSDEGLKICSSTAV